MRLYEFFLGSSREQDSIPQKDWPVYLTTLETCTGKNTNQPQADLGRTFHEIFVRGVGQYNVSFAA